MLVSVTKHSDILRVTNNGEKRRRFRSVDFRSIEKEFQSEAINEPWE